MEVCGIPLIYQVDQNNASDCPSVGLKFLFAIWLDVMDFFLVPTTSL